MRDLYCNPGPLQFDGPLGRATTHRLQQEHRDRLLTLTDPRPHPNPNANPNANPNRWHTRTQTRARALTLTRSTETVTGSCASSRPSAARSPTPAGPAARPTCSRRRSPRSARCSRTCRRPAPRGPAPEAALPRPGEPRGGRDRVVRVEEVRVHGVVLVLQIPPRRHHLEAPHLHPRRGGRPLPPRRLRLRARAAHAPPGARGPAAGAVLAAVPAGPHHLPNPPTSLPPPEAGASLSPGRAGPCCSRGPGGAVRVELRLLPQASARSAPSAMFVIVHGLHGKSPRRRWAFGGSKIF